MEPVPLRPSRRHVPRVRLHCEALEDRLAPATMAVLNTADSGPGSLRQAILDANDTDGDDVITFDTGVAGTIELGSALPRFGSNIELHGPGRDLLTVQPSQAAG